jgi:branched-chain amino acid aminotransferase
MARAVPRLTAVESPAVLRVHPTRRSRLPGLDLAAVPFSSVMSDHMLVAEYDDGQWRRAEIRPYGPLELSPSITALHYGIAVFEGLKAHRTADGRVALFRPRENARRLNRSAGRLAMPAVPDALSVAGLQQLIDVDRAWVPPSGAGALYVRPCLFSTDESIRVKPAERYLFVIFTFPFGSYYAAPVDVVVTERYVRAFPGGTGDVKPAGNYAAALRADLEARDLGCQTVMWLDGRQRRYVEECGVMNVFFVMDTEIVTPSLEGTILPGVTRDSAITLLREAGHTVVERPVAIDEIVDAHDRGALHECFGTGTAATVSHVQRIRYRERDLVLPPVEARRIGPEVRERMMAIAGGREPDTHGWLEYVEVDAGPAGGSEA